MLGLEAITQQLMEIQNVPFAKTHESLGNTGFSAYCRRNFHCQEFPTRKINNIYNYYIIIIIYEVQNISLDV